jgi:hypothetical protein
MLKKALNCIGIAILLNVTPCILVERLKNSTGSRGLNLQGTVPYIWEDNAPIYFLIGPNRSMTNFKMYVTYSFDYVNLLTPELNPSAQRFLPRFLLGILIFKGLTAATSL